MTAIGIYGSAGRMGRAIAQLIEDEGATLAGGCDSHDDPTVLAKNADVHLRVTIDKEACPLDLAPTASTTATLALGDGRLGPFPRGSRRDATSSRRAGTGCGLDPYPAG